MMLSQCMHALARDSHVHYGFTLRMLSRFVGLYSAQLRCDGHWPMTARSRRLAQTRAAIPDTCSFSVSCNVSCVPKRTDNHS